MFPTRNRRGTTKILVEPYAPNDKKRVSIERLAEGRSMGIESDSGVSLPSNLANVETLSVSAYD